MSTKKKEVKVNLQLLKKLVSELESQLSKAEEIITSKTEEDIQNYVIEMSKCTGISAGIVQEATLLIGDLQAAIRINTSAPQKDDALSSLVSLLKGNGTPNAN